MFASITGVFEDIECPSIRRKEPCDLINCWFSHKKPDPPVNVASKRRVSTSAPPKSAAKRVKVDLTGDSQGSSSTSKASTPQAKPSPSLSLAVKAKPSPPVAAATPVARPSTTISKNNGQDATTLIPTTLQASPESFQQRREMLKHIHKEFEKRGEPNPISKAIEAEDKMAQKSTKRTYRQDVRNLMMQIRKGTYGKDPDEGKYTIEKMKPRMEKMILPVHVLKRYGFVTEPVVSTELTTKFDTTCARCGFEYNTGDTAKVKCRYHPLRPVFEYDYHESRKQKRYGCCSENAEATLGCCFSDRHVFKLNKVEEMASVIPFAATTNTTTPNTLFAAGLDCEMGYTTFGMELIRVTIVDWETGKTVLDRQTHPYGKVIDLNSQFSGVHSLDEMIVDETGNPSPTISFKEARSLINRFISANTIMIGHGLENDLNAMRLVHHRIIDTALIYPKYLPHFRTALKNITFQYLSRVIQQGEHDSSEDAIAAMDIVTHHIKQDIKNGK